MDIFITVTVFIITTMSGVPLKTLLPAIVKILTSSDNIDPAILKAARRESQNYSILGEEPNTICRSDKAWQPTLSVHNTTEHGCLAMWEIAEPASPNARCKYKVIVDVTNKQTGQRVANMHLDTNKREVKLKDLQPGCCYHVNVRLTHWFQVNGVRWTCVLAQRKISLITRRAPNQQGVTPHHSNLRELRALTEQLQRLNLEPGTATRYSTGRRGSGQGTPAHPHNHVHYRGEDGLPQRKFNGQMVHSPGHHHQRVGTGHGPGLRMEDKGWHDYGNHDFGFENEPGASPSRFPRGDRRPRTKGFSFAPRSGPNITYLEQLHRKACQFIFRWKNNNTVLIDYLYRNKPYQYFKHIVAELGGEMVPYTKDNNGDPRSPINDRLKGLFFSGMVDQSGDLPMSSPFGNTRFIVPVQRLFHRFTNLYFSDFYCNNKDQKPHYVTLVLTEDGSMADRFCATRLMPLNRFNNPYLRMDPYNGHVWICTNVWIEILYTETINVLREIKWGGAEWQFSMETVGKGSSSPGGIPKNPDCTVCNV